LLKREFQTEKDFIERIHHILMKEYGWMSLDEFRSLPIPTCFNLLNQIKEDYEAQKREMDKIKSKSRVRK